MILNILSYLGLLFGSYLIFYNYYILVGHLLEAKFPILKKLNINGSMAPFFGGLITACATNYLGFKWPWIFFLIDYSIPFSIIAFFKISIDELLWKRRAAVLYKTKKDQNKYLKEGYAVVSGLFDQNKIYRKKLNSMDTLFISYNDVTMIVSIQEELKLFNLNDFCEYHVVYGEPDEGPNTLIEFTGLPIAYAKDESK